MGVCCSAGAPAGSLDSAAGWVACSTAAATCSVACVTGSGAGCGSGAGAAGLGAGSGAGCGLRLGCRCGLRLGCRGGLRLGCRCGLRLRRRRRGRWLGRGRRGGLDGGVDGGLDRGRCRARVDRRDGRKALRGARGREAEDRSEECGGQPPNPLAVTRSNPHSHRDHPRLSVPAKRNRFDNGCPLPRAASPPCVRSLTALPSSGSEFSVRWPPLNRRRRTLVREPPHPRS